MEALIAVVLPEVAFAAYNTYIYVCVCAAMTGLNGGSWDAGLIQGQTIGVSQLWGEKVGPLSSLS